MLANVLQKADSHILERRLVERLVEKREQGPGRHAIYSMHIPRTRSSIYSNRVRSTGHCGMRRRAAQSQGFVAASDMTMTDWGLTTDPPNCTGASTLCLTTAKFSLDRTTS